MISRYENWIPDVPKDELISRSSRIRPVIRCKKNSEGEPKRVWSSRGELYYIKPVNIFGIAYTWDPVIDVKAPDFIQLEDVRTYHRWSYYGFFKPSIAECLAQIPDEILDKTVAFEIIDFPQDSSDLNREYEAFRAGYHVAVTRYYGMSDIDFQSHPASEAGFSKKRRKVPPHLMAPLERKIVEAAIRKETE